MKLNTVLQFFNDDMVVGLARMVMPSAFRRTGKTGRPRKRTMSEQVKTGVVIAKLVMTGIQCRILRDRGDTTGEHSVIILSYVAGHLDELDLVDMYPASSNWVVGRALQAIGWDAGAIPKLSWEEIASWTAQAFQQGAAQMQVQQFVQTARAKGLTDEQVLTLWNALQDQYNAAGARTVATSSGAASATQGRKTG